MCLKSGEALSSYVEGTYVMASLKEGWSTPDPSNVPTGTRRLAAGLSLLGRCFPRPAEDGRGFAFPLDVDWSPPALSTDPWLSPGLLWGLFPTDLDDARARCASSFTLMMTKSLRREFTLEQSRFSTIGIFLESMKSFVYSRAPLSRQHTLLVVGSLASAPAWMELPSMAAWSWSGTHRLDLWAPLQSCTSPRWCRQPGGPRPSRAPSSWRR